MLLIVVLMVVPIVMVISYSFRDNVIVQENSVFAGPPTTPRCSPTRLPGRAQEHRHLHHGQHRGPPGPRPRLRDDAQHPVAERGHKAIFRIVYILPWLFTIAVIAVIWRLLLDPSGVVNYVLHTLGVIQEGVNWLGDPGTALWAARSSTSGPATRSS